MENFDLPRVIDQLKAIAEVYRTYSHKDPELESKADGIELAISIVELESDRERVQIGENDVLISNPKSSIFHIIDDGKTLCGSSSLRVDTAFTMDRRDADAKDYRICQKCDDIAKGEYRPSIKKEE